MFKKFKLYTTISFLAAKETYKKASLYIKSEFSNHNIIFSTKTVFNYLEKAIHLGQ